MVALRNFSASQITAFNNCRRVWFIQWVLRIKGAQSGAQLRGIEIHEILEHYLRTGHVLSAFEIDPVKYPEFVPCADCLDATGVLQPSKDCPECSGEGKVTRQGHGLGYERYIEWCVPFLPAHDEEHLAVEQQIFLNTPDGTRIGGYDDSPEGDVPLTGFIDMGLWGRTIPEIWDLKTTSNVRYNKTPAELHEDVQLNIYARWVFEVQKDLDEVKCGLIYVKVEGPNKKAPATARVKSKKVFAVHTTISRASNEQFWARDAATMNEMVELAAEFDGDDSDGTFLQAIQPNVNFCSAYGGCDHKERCGISVQDTLYKPTENEGKISMGFMDKVKAKRAADEAAAGGEATAPAPEASAPKETAPPVVVEATAEATAAPKKSAAQLFKDRLKNKPVTVVASADAAEVPAEAAAAAAAAAAAEAAATAAAAAAAAAEAKAAAAAATAAAAAAPAAADAIMSPDAAPRSTGAERSAELRGEAQEKADKKAAKKATKPRKKAHKRTLTIYFGCNPIKGEHQAFTMAEDWCHELMAALNSELEEKTSKGYWGQDFSGQKDSLGQAVQARVEAGDIPEVMVCKSGGLVREITNMLIPFASDAVEG